MKDTFGISSPNPPYKIVGTEERTFLTKDKKKILVDAIKMEKTDDWYQVGGEHGEWDKYFTFWRCEDGTGGIFYDRQARDGYEHLQNNHSMRLEDLLKDI